MHMHPCLSGEERVGWVGARSWLAGGRSGAGHTWSAPDAALPVLRRRAKGGRAAALPDPS